MPLANPATTLTTANQAVIISYSQRSTGPGPGPCHWRNAGPMLLADDTPGGHEQRPPFGCDLHR